MKRRFFLRGTITFAASAWLTSFATKNSHAAWLAEHFSTDTFENGFNRLHANQVVVDSDKISVSLPQIAENGAVVPITISSELDDIENIFVWVEKNPTPLAAEFELSPEIAVYITARIKMAESCNVIVIARRGEQLLRCRQWVKVMQGGCGTG